MTQQAYIDRAASLEALYSRIARIAKSMGGTACQSLRPVGLANASVMTPRTEETPALQVQMPHNFQVLVMPCHPLSEGNALSVQVMRTFNGLRKSDCKATYLQNEWQMTNEPLTDDEIRKCLTPEGP